VAANAPIIRAAAALKRSSTSVRAQARKLGTPFPHMRDYRRKLIHPTACVSRPIAGERADIGGTGKSRPEGLRDGLLGD